MFSRFESFVTFINQLYRSIQKIKSREMTEMGLKGTHVMCLFYLDRHPEGLTAAQLCNHCMEDKAAVSRAVNKLEAKGLVTLEESEGQRRYRSKIRLTKAGKQITCKMMRLIAEIVDKGGEGLTDEERETFYRSLGMIAKNLQTLCSEKGESD